MPLCTLFAAVLSACGGGDGGAATDAVALAANTDSSALRAPANRVSTLATEGGTFSVTGTQIVKYGAGSLWIRKSVSGTGQCTNEFFGTDPAFGSVKSCQLAGSGETSTPTATPVLGPAPAPRPRPSRPLCRWLPKLPLSRLETLFRLRPRLQLQIRSPLPRLRLSRPPLRRAA